VPVKGTVKCNESLSQFTVKTLLDYPVPDITALTVLNFLSLYERKKQYDEICALLEFYTA
jgi:hypothetical protein